MPLWQKARASKKHNAAHTRKTSLPGRPRPVRIDSVTPRRSAWHVSDGRRVVSFRTVFVKTGPPAARVGSKALRLRVFRPRQNEGPSPLPFQRPGQRRSRFRREGLFLDREHLQAEEPLEKCIVQLL